MTTQRYYEILRASSYALIDEMREFIEVNDEHFNPEICFRIGVMMGKYHKMLRDELKKEIEEEENG